MPLSCERIGNAYSSRLDSWRFRVREGVVKRGFPNFQPGGGFPDVQALGEQGASAFKFAGRDDRASPAVSTARGGGDEPRHCALFDEIALESGQSAEDMEDQPAAGRRRIDIGVSARFGRNCTLTGWARPCRRWRRCRGGVGTGNVLWTAASTDSKRWADPGDLKRCAFALAPTCRLMRILGPIVM